MVLKLATFNTLVFWLHTCCSFLWLSYFLSIDLFSENTFLITFEHTGVLHISNIKFLFQVNLIVSCLWDTLLDLDDLTASTNSIMSLLVSLLAHPVVTRGGLQT